MRIYETEIVVSPSSLTSRMECSEGHAMRYTDGLPGLPALTFARGTSLHKGMQTYFLSRATDPDINPIDKDIIDTATAAAVSELCRLQEEGEQTFGVKFDQIQMDYWYRVYTIGIPKYIRLIGQYLEPIMIEEEIRAEIGEIDGKPVILAGYVDLLSTATKTLEEFFITEGFTYIIDFKTAARAGVHITNKIQVLCYQLILYLKHKKAATQLHKFILQKPCKKRPEADCKISVEDIPGMMTDDIASWLIDLITAHTKQFMLGARSPDGVTGFGCATCSQRMDCDYYGGYEL